MHQLEKDVRDAGELFLAAKKAARAAGFRVDIQSGADGEFINVSGGPVVDPEKPEGDQETA